MANPFRWLANRILGTGKTPDRRQKRRAFRARYDAAQTTEENRRHWAEADALSANAAHDPGVRKKLRERSRYECANNGYLGGMVESIANDMVGTGPRPQLRIPGVSREVTRSIELTFLGWALAADLPEDLRLLQTTYLRDGEMFGVMVDNPALTATGRTAVTLDLRLYESEQIADPWDLGPDPLYSDGVRVDRHGNPVEYTFLKNHPGGVAPSWETEKLPASAVVHWFKPVRAGQTRGVPVVAPGLPLGAQLRRYTLATLGAAELAAMLAGILKTNLPPTEDGKPLEPETMDAIELVRNALLTLPDQWDAVQFKPEQPVSTFKEFKGEVLNEMGRPCQVPFNVIAGNSSGYNFSSGRLDHLLYHRALRVDRGRMRLRVLDRLFVAWVQEAALAGVIPPALPPIATWSWEWFWDGFDSIEPDKDAATDETQLRTNTTTLAEIYARKGQDWEEQLRQRAREVALMQELGLTVAAAAPAPTQGVAPVGGTAGPPLIRAARSPRRTGVSLTAPVRIAAADAAEPKKPRTFELVAYTGEPMRIGWWEYPVVVDLDTLDVSAQTLPALYDHCPDVDFVVGQTNRVAVQDGRLVASGRFIVTDAPAERNYAARVLANADAGYQWQASIGGDPASTERVEAGKTVNVNGRDYAGPVIVARGVQLREISFVVLGGDRRTSAVVARRIKGARAMTFEEWLLALGFDDPAALTDIQRANLTLLYNEEYPEGGDEPPPDEPPADEPPTPAAAAPANAGANPPAVRSGRPAARPSGGGRRADPVADTRREVAEELRRHGEIRQISATYGVTEVEVGTGRDRRRVDLVAHAVAEGWTRDQTELAAMRASRPVPGRPTAAGGPDQFAVLEAALAQAGRLEGIDRAFPAPVLEAAHARFHGRIGLQEFLLEAAHAGGYTGSPNVRGNLRPVLQAAFSTVSLPGIFVNTVNKFLLMGYMNVEGVWRLLAARRSVSDFKAVTSYRLTDNLMFEKVGPDGEIKHGTLGEESYTNRVETYAKMLGLTRQDIINDDLSALTTVPQRLGRGGGLALNDLFWRTFLNNSTFFTTARLNYLTGAATVLDPTSLGVAVAQFLKLVDPQGNPLAVTPKFLVVPPELSVMADTLYVTTNWNTGGAATAAQVGNANIFARKYQPVTSAYLSNANYPGSSALAWYLLADPNDIAVIEMVFLNGVEVPTVETADVNFNQLGVEMRGVFDIGAALQDPNGGIKVKGAA